MFFLEIYYIINIFNLCHLTVCHLIWTYIKCYNRICTCVNVLRVCLRTCNSVKDYRMPWLVAELKKNISIRITLHPFLCNTYSIFICIFATISDGHRTNKRTMTDFNLCLPAHLPRYQTESWQVSMLVHTSGTYQTVLFHSCHSPVYGHRYMY